MTLPQKIENYFRDPALRALWGWNMDQPRQYVKALFVTNNGSFLFVCQVYLDC